MYSAHETSIQSPYVCNFKFVSPQEEEAKQSQEVADLIPAAGIDRTRVSHLHTLSPVSSDEHE